jgi:cytochrome c oxidase subunit 4
MSHAHTDDHSNSHGEHGADGHHISSVRTLATVLIVLLALTVLTVYVAKFVPASEAAHIVMALIIASTKGAIVCLYFMHLMYDRVFYSAILVSCLFVFSLFLLFTILDIGGRAQIDPVRAQLITAVPADMVGKARYTADELVGRELFMANCSVCHGVDGAGVQGLGKMLQNNQFIKERTVPELAEFLAVGRPAHHPLNETGVTMPARAGNPNLTDQQLVQIASFLKVMPNRQIYHGAPGFGGHDKGHGDESHADESHGAAPAH